MNRTRSARRPGVTATATAAALLLACTGLAGTAQAQSPSTSEEKEIERNWEEFYDPRTTLNEKADLLQNGNLLGPLLERFAGDSRLGQVDADVTEVDVTSEDRATVTYTLELAGTPVLRDATGTAVKQDDTWKVGLKSLCSLIQQDPETSDVPGC